MAWIFWTSLALLAFSFVGYPVVLALLLKLRDFRKNPDVVAGGADGSSAATASVVLVVRDEEAQIAGRIADLLSARDVEGLDWEILVVCDGCTDATAQRARLAGGDQLRVIELAESRGKANGVNVGVAEASGEIVIFADARQRFDERAIARLLAAFDDSKVGAASGSLEIESSEAGAGAGVDLYWRLEKFTRQAESRIDSCIGCTGAIYAIRRDLFEPMPEDTVLDDVVVPMRIAVAGGQVKFLAEAKAYDPQKLAPESERRRKTRTLAGNFQMLMRYPGWLLPWRNRLWWQLIAHKYLRLAGPALLVICLLSNLALISSHWFFMLTMAAQLALYLLAMIGLLLPALRNRLLTVPAGFVLLQWFCVLGFFEWLRRSLSGQGGTWK